MDTIQILQTQIEKFSQEELQINPFFRGAKERRVSSQELYIYINNLRHLVVHTPIHLSMAIDEARKRSDSSLVEFLEQKLEEEQGHDKWGEQDLNFIKTISPMENFSDHILPSMERFIASNTHRIYRNPKFYLIHILFAEYFTVICGSEILDRLCHSTGIVPQRLSIIAKHVELDRSHVKSFVAELSQFLKRAPKKNGKTNWTLVSLSTEISLMILWRWFNAFKITKPIRGQDSRMVA